MQGLLGSRVLGIGSVSTYRKRSRTHSESEAEARSKVRVAGGGRVAPKAWPSIFSS